MPDPSAHAGEEERDKESGLHPHRAHHQAGVTRNLATLSAWEVPEWNRSTEAS